MNIKIKSLKIKFLPFIETKILKINFLPFQKKLSLLSKEKFKNTISKRQISETLSKMPVKQKLIVAVSTIPFLAISTMSSSCATTCPYGMVNDPFPGQCSRYMDIGGDGFCDFSQATPVTNNDPSTTSTDGTGDTSTTTTTSPINEGHGNGANSDIASNQPSDTNTTVITDSPSLDSGTVNTDPTNYNVLPISLILIGGYLFTYFLFKKGILKKSKHRRIWNLLVTAGYMGTGVTGVILTLMINLGIRTALNSSLNYWHAELAILMVIGTIIHVHMYWKPFKNMFKVLFGFNSNLRKISSKNGGTSSDYGK